MNIEIPNDAPKPTTWVLFDLESAVMDDIAHKRYQKIERWKPHGNNEASRRNYEFKNDPLRNPRWTFQTIVTAAVAVMTQHPDGNVQLMKFETFSAPEYDERGIIEALFSLLNDVPKGAEMVSWGGAAHDLPLLRLAAQKHGLSFPKDWLWAAFAGDGRARHLDLARIATGGLKMRQVHQSEFAAALDIPAKITAPAWTVARHIYAGRWDIVTEICEGDVVTLMLLFARWRQTIDGRALADVVEDRILRQIIEMKTGRGYVAALEQHREERLKVRLAHAANDTDWQEPHLSERAA